MDSAAGSNAACTSHYYDYAGRVLTNVLPDGSVVNMSYDSGGGAYVALPSQVVTTKAHPSAEQSGTTTTSVVFDAANGEILADFSDTGITEKLEFWPSWARTPVIDRRTAPVGDKGGFAEESSGSQITMSGDSMNPFIFNPVCQGCLLDNSIDYRVTFNLGGGKVNNIDVFHDGFPGYELRVNGQHTYGYSPAAPGDREGPFQLFGGLGVHKRINCDRNRLSKC